jgi:hypothetical protein
MQITINDLESYTQVLFEHLRQLHGTQIDIPYEYYWSIPADMKYDPYKRPSEMTLGQISFDVANLNDVLSGAIPATTYDLSWLAAILNAIADSQLG